jgi:DNA-binding FadR family transcriptional regulator
MPLTPKKATIVEEVFDQLRRQILSDHYRAGDRLPPERDLAAALGTNRNTLREAVRRLEQAHLVRVRQGSGVTVTDFRRTGGIELIEPFLVHGADGLERARAMMDLLVARTEVLSFALLLVTERGTPADWERIRALRAQLTERFAAGDQPGLAAGFSEWIHALVDAAHSLPARWIANPFLRLTERFTEEFPALWVLDPSFPAYLLEIEQAIEARDAVRAERANRTYFDKIDAIVVPLLRQVLGDEVDAFERRTAG